MRGRTGMEQPMPPDFYETINKMAVQLTKIEGDITHISDKRSDDHTQIVKLNEKMDKITEKIHAVELEQKNLINKLDEKIAQIKVEVAKFSTIISIVTAVIATSVAAYIKG
jgi:uncharacterized membrane protein YcjF (UPF0283 family)